jgi:hypothetical protein
MTMAMRAIDYSALCNLIGTLEGVQDRWETSKLYAGGSMRSAIATLQAFKAGQVVDPDDDMLHMKTKLDVRCTNDGANKVFSAFVPEKVGAGDVVYFELASSLFKEGEEKPTKLPDIPQPPMDNRCYPKPEPDGEEKPAVGATMKEFLSAILTETMKAKLATMADDLRAEACDLGKEKFRADSKPEPDGVEMTVESVSHYGDGDPGDFSSVSCHGHGWAALKQGDKVRVTKVEGDICRACLDNRCCPGPENVNCMNEFKKQRKGD